MASTPTKNTISGKQVLFRLAVPILIVTAGLFIFLRVNSPRPDTETHTDHQAPVSVNPVVLDFDGEYPLPPEGIEVPEGMVYIPGGETEIGSEKGLPMEMPVFQVEVSPFLMDKHPVTVAQFSAFVEATGHVTQAESFGDSAVLDDVTKNWILLKGANWKYPLGPDQPPANENHPVTHVSWNDAVAYAAWAGKRLPSEIEWEHAARGAVNRRMDYAWGNVLHSDHEGEHHTHANTWEGNFPQFNTGEDGFLRTSPVGAFGASPIGLEDMGGNVWEWTDSWYRSYAERNQPYTETPQSERVQRGGSFLCNSSYCHGYRVSARSHSTPESSHFHVGFRTVKDVPVSGD